MAQLGQLRASGDWVADLRDYYGRMHALFTAHGDIASYQFGSVPTTERSLRAFADAIALLTAAGVPEDLAVRGTERLSLHVTADAFEKWVFTHAPGGPQWPTPDGIATSHPELGGVLARAAALNEDPFEFGLELILVGLRQAVADRASADADRPRG